MRARCFRPFLRAIYERIRSCDPSQQPHPLQLVSIIRSVTRGAWLFCRNNPPCLCPRVQLVQNLAANLKSVQILKSPSLFTFPVHMNPSRDAAGQHVSKAMQSAGRNAKGLLDGLPDCDDVITLCFDLCCTVMDATALYDDAGFFAAGTPRDLAISTIEFFVELCTNYDLKPVLRSARAGVIIRSLFGASLVNSPGQAATAAGVPFTLSLRSAGSDIVTLLSGYGTRPHFPKWTVSGQFRAVRSRV